MFSIPVPSGPGRAAGFSFIKHQTRAALGVGDKTFKSERVSVGGNLLGGQWGRRRVLESSWIVTNTGGELRKAE